MLVTHGPPHGILDLVPSDMSGNYEHAGREELLKAVRRLKPKLHIFGHIHEGYGVVNDYMTTFANASTCDAAYRPVNAPVVLELNGKRRSADVP